MEIQAQFYKKKKKSVEFIDFEIQSQFQELFMSRGKDLH